MVYDKRGISSVISVALITLGAVIGVSLLWVFANKNIENAQGEITDPDCLTVNLELFDCKAYGACDYYLGSGGYEAEVLVKRSVGQGNVTGLRFIFEDNLSVKGTYDVDLKTKSLEELQTISFVKPYVIPVQTGLPYKLRVAALIGSKKDVCPITSASVRCPIMNNPPPLGNLANPTYTPSSQSPYVNNRGGTCCQHPVNTSECYNGGNLNYPIDPSNHQLRDGLLPPGKKNVCCIANPLTGGLPTNAGGT